MVGVRLAFVWISVQSGGDLSKVITVEREREVVPVYISLFVCGLSGAVC